METKIVNFKKSEVFGATKQEALDAAPFNIMGDATQAYKNFKKENIGTAITESMEKEFMLSYLAKKSKSTPGVGYSITVDAAVANTRERPYKITDTKNKQGRRKYKTTFVLTDKKTGVVKASTQETKAKAKEIAKDLYKKGYTGELVCTYTKQVAEGESVAFTAAYTPSKSSNIGKYIVFGIEA